MTGIQEILILIIIVVGLIYLPRMRGKNEASDVRIAIPITPLSGTMRLAIVASLIWPLVAAFFLKPWKADFLMFLYAGLGPVILGWSIRWIVVGFRRKGR